MVSTNEQAISRNGTDQYVYAMLYYKDVPNLTAANFHWLNAGCGEFAVTGSTGGLSC